MEGEGIKMLDKVTYINMENENEAGQKADGTWYCKSLKFKDNTDLRDKIILVNKVLNEMNSDNKYKFRTEKKEAGKK